MAGSDVTLPQPKHGLFDRWSWFYAFCRERLFADHTEQICKAIKPVLDHREAPLMMEVGCGPGFYSCRMAKRFPRLSVLGVDLSDDLLRRAEARARLAGVTQNCRFVHIDALQLAEMPDYADFIIVSRLLLILPHRRSTMDAIFITLRPGGRVFIAEPVSPTRSSIPLLCMKLLEALSGHPRRSLTDTTEVNVLSNSQFDELIDSQPWQRVRQWTDWRYQYAVCEKAP